MNRENYVTKSNKLIEAKGRMTALEQKIFSMLISEIQPGDKDFKEYIFEIKKFIKLTGVNDNKIYMDIHKSARRLMSKIITIENDETIITTALLSSVETPKGEGIVKITFHPFLKPFLLDIKERFTKYQLKNVLNLKGAHSIRIYELLKQYEKIKSREFDLLELKKILGIENEYERIYDFERFVLKPAKNEINKHTDLFIEYKKIKEGRRVVKIKFNIEGKIDKEEALIDSLYSKQEIEEIKRKCGLSGTNFNSKQIMELYEIAVKKTESTDIDPHEYIKLNYNNMISNGTARNKFAWLKKALEDDYAKAAMQISMNYYIKAN